MICPCSVMIMTVMFVSQGCSEIMYCNIFISSHKRKYSLRTWFKTLFASCKLSSVYSHKFLYYTLHPNTGSLTVLELTEVIKHKFECVIPSENMFLYCGIFVH